MYKDKAAPDPSTLSLILHAGAGVVGVVMGREGGCVCHLSKL